MSECKPETPDEEAGREVAEGQEQLLTLGPEIIILTGMSGAGRTEALHALEDLGYFCIDNLPPTMLVSLAKLVGFPTENNRHLAVVCDVRSQEFFDQFTEELEKLAEQEVSYEVVFLNASDESLVKRFSSLRRRHPLAKGRVSVANAIAREREQLSSIHEIANVVIDTSSLSSRELRKHIQELFSARPAIEGLNVSVCSFGFKYGLPMDADLVIDVRFLPNPYYDPQMRDLTGFDASVRDFVLGNPETQSFLSAWEALLDAVMPGYVNEGKQHLTICVGCTGGQHRSVALAEKTGEYLRAKGYLVATSHRDVARSSATGGQR